MIRRPPRSPLFPYPPPFRSRTRRFPPRLSRLATDVRGGGDAAGDPRAERGDLERRGLKLSVVIPAHNEEASIGPTLLGVTGVLATERIDYEVLVVDDASTDRTA